MPAVDRAEIMRRAKDAFREHGRGFVVVMEDREEPHYGFLPELEELLEGEPEAKTLLDAAFVALELYQPDREAVVIDSRPEGIYVMVVWASGVWTVGEIVWSRTH